MNIKHLFVLALFVALLFAADTAAFGQGDVTMSATAITVPREELVLVNFQGTTQFPRMKGEARIKRTSRNGTEIDLSVSKMPRPFELGVGYATYVLWAISPDGQAANLGEIKRRGYFEFDSKISVTTPLQTFALVITAEPHFLVRRPSQKVMMKNLSPYTLTGKSIGTTNVVQYFGNSSDYFRDSRTPAIAEADYSKTPSTVLQAKQSIALARFAGAERDASAELAEAETLFLNAEAAWKAGRREEDVDITARKAISLAVKAEETAAARREAREKRNEKARSDAEIRRAEQKYTDAQSEIADLKAELARETRNRELGERDVLNYSNQIRDLKEENARLRDELTRTKIDADNAKEKLAALQQEKNAIEEQRENEARIAKIRIAEPALIQSLRSYGTVTREDRGIVISLPETLWVNFRATTLVPQAEGKLTSLAELILNNPGYDVSIESHTDNAGNPESIQAVTDGRSRLIYDRFVGHGIEEARITAKGYGASVQVAPNTTPANRAKNRRLLVILKLRQ